MPYQSKTRFLGRDYDPRSKKAGRGKHNFRSKGTLPVTMQCIRCAEVGVQKVEMYFGPGNFRVPYEQTKDTYKLGEAIPWHPSNSVLNGGRPDNGDFDGEGRAICPHCRKDFWVTVHVRNDVIESVEPDWNREPLLTDRDAKR